MTPGEFVLDGVSFGGATAIDVRDFDPGARVVITQDAPIPGGHGRLMGEDFDDGPEWSWELAARTEDGSPAFDLLAPLERAWKGATSRGTAGRLSVLRYALPGRERRVYGRPRRWAPLAGAVSDGWHHGYYAAACTFQLADPVIYDDVPRSLELVLAPPSIGGVTYPLTYPVTYGVAGGERQGVVDVAGDAEVPFEVTFHGPVTGSASGFWASGPGWKVSLDTTIAWNQSVTVDTREHTVTRSDGASLAGRARGRFLAARLRRGTQEFRFGATDPTNTARAVIRWRDGYHSL